MREIKAYLRKNMLDNVIDALALVPGLPGIAVVEVQEYGHAIDNGRLVKSDMVKLEIDVSKALVEPVVEAILEYGRTGHGHPGDGKVFISDLREAVRIADGQRGRVAVER